MNIKRLETPYTGHCGYCARETILRYKVKLKSKGISICTICYEEQMDFQK